MVLLKRLPTRSSPTKPAVPREWFVPALVGVVVAASFLPCRGSADRAFDALAVLAIASLFFPREHGSPAMPLPRVSRIGAFTSA